ncbi:hypothetical protein MTO96_013414 [Rhipicephalus appendiculatus]
MYAYTTSRRSQKCETFGDSVRSIDTPRAVAHSDRELLVTDREDGLGLHEYRNNEARPRELYVWCIRPQRTDEMRHSLSSSSIGDRSRNHLGSATSSDRREMTSAEEKRRRWRRPAFLLTGMSSGLCSAGGPRLPLPRAGCVGRRP